MFYAMVDNKTFLHESGLITFRSYMSLSEILTDRAKVVGVTILGYNKLVQDDDHTIYGNKS